VGSNRARPDDSRLLPAHAETTGREWASQLPANIVRAVLPLRLGQYAIDQRGDVSQRRPQQGAPLAIIARVRGAATMNRIAIETEFLCAAVQRRRLHDTLGRPHSPAIVRSASRSRGKLT
jgi:hypothetical protein